jgi:hypothetical protein
LPPTKIHNVGSSSSILFIQGLAGNNNNNKTQQSMITWCPRNFLFPGCDTDLRKKEILRQQLGSRLGEQSRVQQEDGSHRTGVGGEMDMIDFWST